MDSIHTYQGLIKGLALGCAQDTVLNEKFLIPKERSFNNYMDKAWKVAGTVRKHIKSQVQYMPNKSFSLFHLQETISFLYACLNPACLLMPLVVISGEISLQKTHTKKCFFHLLAFAFSVLIAENFKDNRFRDKHHLTTR